MIGKANGCKGARRPSGAHAFALPRAWLILVGLGLALLPSCAGAGSGQQPVTLSIANASQEPLRCMILFAHFVATDVGPIAPNDDLALAMFRQDEDGALFIPRADGRRMMIETIDCGAAARWAETRGQISLLPARAGRDARYGTTCRLAGAVSCADPAPLP
jgi:hypothetical protein